MEDICFSEGSVPVCIAAKVYGKDASWIRAGIIVGWLPIGKATRKGRIVTRIEEMDSKYGRINFYEVIQEDTKMSTLFSGIVSDIYEYAKEYDADYYDIKNGYIYHVQEYNRLVGLGIKNTEIRITDEFGNHVGYAKRIKES